MTPFRRPPSAVLRGASPEAAASRAAPPIRSDATRYAERLRRALLRGLLLLALAGVTFGAFWAGAWLHRFAYTSAFFAVRQVNVRGATPELEARLRAVLTQWLSEEGANLCALQTESLADRLTAQPRARTVAVHKAYPQTLRIAVEERRPLLVAILERPYLIDREGVILAPASARVRRELHLPVLTGLPRRTVQPGEQVDPARLADIVEAVEFLRDHDRLLAARIVEWNVSGRGEVTALLRGATEVRFGGERPLAHLEKLSAALQLRPELEHAEYIDLRMERQIVYR